ncbi:MAG: DUF262 domain-containing protein [Chloroflexota bacterium]|nr:DUF262 domain-containing protein [Chloroflexota bacterium]
MAVLHVYEDEGKLQEPDPGKTPYQSTRLYTQPYDLVIESLLSQIENGTVHLRHISDRPKFQRRYVWPDYLASRLIESILMNVPIPPCYLAQNKDFRLDVIDGQQRMLSVYRFLKNEFKLSGLEVLEELNGKRSFEIPSDLKRKIETYTLRCVVVTNDSDPDIRFEVFERLNTSTMPLNAQELRNSIYRGALNDLLGQLANDPSWLSILNRKQPDSRMRGEELILRFFAFHLHGLEGYKTPQKSWLNEVADQGRGFTIDEIAVLSEAWKNTLHKCLLVFDARECFRRLPITNRQVVNRALMDLTMHSLRDTPTEVVESISKEYYCRVERLFEDEEFNDLITRAIDHKSRTRRRFDIWSEKVTFGLF